jgi:outer membrane protein assembly factor BamB
LFRYAIDASSAKEKGIFQTNRGCGASPVITSDGKTAFIGCENNFMYAINTDKMTQKWAVRTDYGIRSKAAISADDTKVYFTGYDGLLRAHYVGTGKVVWMANYQGSKQRIYSEPVISRDGKVIYYGSYDKYIYAVHAATGALKWKVLPVNSGQVCILF